MPDSPSDLPKQLLSAIESAAKSGLHQAVDLGRVAVDAGRHQLELRQARRDLDAYYTRLGQVTFELAKDGKVLHPTISDAVDRIERAERLVADLEHQA